ncbi:MAG TPA: LodA/GoxA family CTQ-dependent oxidase [Polyangiaceae bacterium]|nr:LodA/GoxA family CTQ-dependent oxidase [Polyangiaceae bacterium]
MPRGRTCRPLGGAMAKATYRIHPALGFARVGNAPDAFYLEPTREGGLPTEMGPPGEERPVREFKAAGMVKRQAVSTEAGVELRVNGSRARSHVSSNAVKDACQCGHPCCTA